MARRWARPPTAGRSRRSRPAYRPSTRRILSTPIWTYLLGSGLLAAAELHDSELTWQIVDRGR
eukprot:7085784-Pyramimonas_sp.AAC.1